MIHGIGVDTAQVARIEKSIAHLRFMARVYGAQEQAYLVTLSPARRGQTAAAMWAAKEAFGKAFGCGISGFSLPEVQLLHTPQGAPFFGLEGRAAALAEGFRVHLSITHEGGFATAFVVAEQLRP